MTGNPLTIVFLCLIFAQAGPARADGTFAPTDFMKQHAITNDAAFVEEWAKLDVNQRLSVLDAALSDETYGLRNRHVVLEKIIETTPPFQAGSETATLHSIYVSMLTELVALIWKFDYEGVADKPEDRLIYALKQIREKNKTPDAPPKTSGAPIIGLPPSVNPSVPKETPSVAPSTPVEESPASTRWPLVTVVVVAVLGLLWVLLKKRK